MTLPPPDTHCWDEDTSKDVWSHSADQMRAYAEQAVAAETERCAALCEGAREAANHSSNGARRIAAMAMAESCAKLIRAE